MSSIHKQGNKPNWFCAFYDPEGFRRFRTTGTENPRVARNICSAIERASVLARQGKLSEQKGLKLIRETCAAIEEIDGRLAADAAMRTLKANVEEFVRIAGGELVTFTIRDWLTSWLADRTDASLATRAEYQRIASLFVTFLGTRADRPLAVLQPKQIEDFKADLSERVAPSTVNKAIKVLKASFGAAVAKRQLSSTRHSTSHRLKQRNRSAGRS
jgi:hypothetical protein